MERDRAPVEKLAKAMQELEQRRGQLPKGRRALIVIVKEFLCVLCVSAVKLFLISWHPAVASAIGSNNRWSGIARDYR